MRRHVAWGPFTSLALAKIEIWEQSVRAAIALGSSRLREYLTVLDRKRLLLSHPVINAERGQFYLAHPDSHAAQYLALDGKLSAVLDWETFVITLDTSF